jgi:Phospholipase_D-nuclease N-terminal
MTLAATGYPLADLLWTFVMFFSLIIFFWLLITVFGDLFRRQDLSGWAKAAWTVFVIFLPMIGTLVYLISQGRSMADRGTRQVQQVKAQNEDRIRSAASPGYRRVADIARGKELLDQGSITPEEFDQLKRQALADDRPAAATVGSGSTPAGAATR